jgi:hypothetical protein
MVCETCKDEIDTGEGDLAIMCPQCRKMSPFCFPRELDVYISYYGPEWIICREILVAENDSTRIWNETFVEVGIP